MMMNQRLTTIAGHAFVVSDSAGDIGGSIDCGLFVADTRFLSRYEVRLDGTEPGLLRSHASGSTTARIYASNVDLGEIPDYSLELIRDRRLGHNFSERISLTNRGHLPVDLELSVAIDADFADIFEVRSMMTTDLPKRAVGRSERGTIRFRDREHGAQRQCRVSFEPRPTSLRRGLARFPLHLEVAETWTLTVDVTWQVPPPATELPIPILASEDEEPLAAWLRHVPDLVTDDRNLDVAYHRAIRDLAMLELALSSGHAIPAAGIPWYMAIFGRDSAITSLQMLMIGPRFAYGTLRTLAAYQARERSDFRDAEPGKMPHEVRFGALAASGAVPHSRYYGTVDATPLWLILLADTFRWTGDRELVMELLPAAERALRWLDEEADLDGDGLIEYHQRSPNGLENQAWKDSWDSVRFADGRFAEPPIAPVATQGYAYAAKQGMADLYETLGRDQDAVRLRAEAARLKQRVQEAFWMPAAGFYALALDGQKRQVDSITSNPGHLLWSGLPDEPYAGQVVDRLLAPENFTGWGIRTMAASMHAYSPISYHNGSVWPHDTALAIAGFRRYGYAREAATVADGLIAATHWFDGHRLPELFCGYDRAESSLPINYPVACSPQAWAAGSVVQVLQELAGIAPADDGLRVVPLPHGRTLRLSGIPFRDERRDVVADAEPASERAALRFPATPAFRATFSKR